MIGHSSKVKSLRRWKDQPELATELPRSELRKQRLRVIGITSDWRHRRLGVPQGSVLGLLLF